MLGGALEGTCPLGPRGTATIQELLALATTVMEYLRGGYSISMVSSSCQDHLLLLEILIVIVIF